MNVGDTVVEIISFLVIIALVTALVIGSYYEWKAIHEVIEETHAHNGTCDFVSCRWTDVSHEITTFINERCLLNGKEVNCSDIGYYERN